MCGRFVASRPISDIVEFFAVDDVEVPEELTQPRWNIAPQAGVLAVTVRRPRPARASDERQAIDTDEGTRPSAPGPSAMTSGGQRGEVAAAAADSSGQPERRRLTSYRWGLVPSWAKDPRFGARAFNARGESLLEKPAFRTALDRRRCLIPADAFYEWEKTSGTGSGQASKGGGRPRQPWCYRAPDGGLMAFGGLWEAWKTRPAAAPAPVGDPPSTVDELAADGWHDDWLLTCTIVTTAANETVSPVHDRMPLVLEPSDWEAWLHPGPLEANDLASLLRTPRVGLLEAYEVSSEVNASSSEGPQLVEPRTDIEPTLF